MDKGNNPYTMYVLPLSFIQKPMTVPNDKKMGYSVTEEEIMCIFDDN